MTTKPPSERLEELAEELDDWEALKAWADERQVEQDELSARVTKHVLGEGVLMGLLKRVKAVEAQLADVGMRGRKIGSHGDDERFPQPEAPPSKVERGLGVGVRGRIEKALDLVKTIPNAVNEGSAKTWTAALANTREAIGLLEEALASSPEVPAPDEDLLIKAMSLIEDELKKSGRPELEELVKLRCRVHDANSFILRVHSAIGKCRLVDGHDYRGCIIDALGEVPVGETPSAGADPFEAGYDPKLAAATNDRALRKRIAELEAELAKWRDDYGFVDKARNAACSLLVSAEAERDQLKGRLRLWEATREDGQALSQQVKVYWGEEHGEKTAHERFRTMLTPALRYLASLPKPTPLSPEGGQPVEQWQATETVDAGFRTRTFTPAEPAEPAAGEPVRDRVSCKVCGNYADATGELEHGKGCYQVDADGGGTSYHEEADESAAPPSPALPDVKRALELLRDMRALAYTGHLKSAYEDCWEVIKALGGDTAPTGGKVDV